MFAVNDPAVDRRAIGVHIEDGKENADALACGVFTHFGFFDFDDVRDDAIGRAPRLRRDR